MGRNKFSIRKILRKKWEKSEKNNVKIALNVLYAKKKIYILLMFESITQIVKNKLFS